MRSLLAGFTTRGRAFLAAGVAAVRSGSALGQRDAAEHGRGAGYPAAAVRARGRPGPVPGQLPAADHARPGPAGQTATVTIQLDNVTRLPTGLLLAEDTVPYSLGHPAPVRPGPDRAGRQPRELTYRLQSDRRGKFAIGPLNVRVADAFGLVRLGRLVALPGTLVVTPADHAAALDGVRRHLARRTATPGPARRPRPGEDDVVPRAYRDGDELRRVHWRSTARYGELMVRREEQRWRNRAVLFLDTRRRGHGGRGPGLVLRVRGQRRRVDRRAPGAGRASPASSSPTPGRCNAERRRSRTCCSTRSRSSARPGSPRSAPALAPAGRAATAAC